MVSHKSNKLAKAIKTQVFRCWERPYERRNFKKRRKICRANNNISKNSRSVINKSVKTELDLRLEVLLREEEKIIRSIKSILTKDERLLYKAGVIKKYDNIGWMDGSVYFWLYVIEMAKRDFVAFYNHPNRWDVNTPEGKIWISAYAFLFRDDYKISLNVVECLACKDQTTNTICKECYGRKLVKSPDGKKLSLSEILDICKEACKSRKINISVLNPSVEKLRQLLASKIEDKWLTERIKKNSEAFRKM